MRAYQDSRSRDVNVVETTKDEALAAVRAAAWAKQVTTCGHTGCTDHVGDGERYIHVISGFGMDMPLESVEEEIRAAQWVGWTPHILDHDLVAACADGQIHRYDVRRPAGGQWLGRVVADA